MSIATTEAPKTAQPIVEYSVSDAAIDQLRERLTGLTAETPEKYELVRVGIAEVRDLILRVQVDIEEIATGVDGWIDASKIPDTEAA